jgi:hypothetical protein
MFCHFDSPYLACEAALSPIRASLPLHGHAVAVVEPGQADRLGDRAMLYSPDVDGY